MPLPAVTAQNARMALRLIEPAANRFMLTRSVVDRKAVIGHLRTVLNSFANKDGYTKFYIGITGNLQDRLAGHQRSRPDFQLMIPIYEEPAHYMQDSFDSLEGLAISAFRAGIQHPVTKQMLLRCDNGAEAAAPKSTLYILVG
jgi:hypothetical protein